MTSEMKAKKEAMLNVASLLDEGYEILWGTAKDTYFFCKLRHKNNQNIICISSVRGIVRRTKNGKPI